MIDNKKIYDMESDSNDARPEEAKKLEDRTCRVDRTLVNRRVIMSTVSLACRKSYEQCLPLKTPNNIMKNRDVLLDRVASETNYSNGDNINCDQVNINSIDTVDSPNAICATNDPSLNKNFNNTDIISSNSIISNINDNSLVEEVDANPVRNDIRGPIVIQDREQTDSLEKDIIIRDISKCDVNLLKKDHCIIDLDRQPSTPVDEKFMLKQNKEFIAKDEFTKSDKIQIIKQHGRDSNVIAGYDSGPVDRNTEFYQIEDKTIRDRDKEFNDKGIVIIELDQVKIPKIKNQNFSSNHLHQKSIENNVNENHNFIRQKPGDFSLTLVDKYPRNHQGEYQDARQNARNNIRINMIGAGAKEMTYIRQKSNASLEVSNDTYIRLKKQGPISNDATYVRQKSLPDVTAHRGSGNSAGVVSSTSNRMRPPPPPPPLAGHTLSHSGHPPVVNHHSEEPTSSIPDLGEQTTKLN